MTIFIIASMPAAGKNIARQYTETHHYPHFSTGDIVRAEIAKRGLAPDPEISAKISTQLRGEDGMGVTRILAGEAIKKKDPVVFLEGVRSWQEDEVII